MKPLFKHLILRMLDFSDDEKASLFNLESNDPGCSLPRWNGLTPGPSDILELPEFFGSLGFDQLSFFQMGSPRPVWVNSDDLNLGEWGVYPSYMGEKVVAIPHKIA